MKYARYIFVLLVLAGAAFGVIATDGAIQPCTQNTGSTTFCVASITLAASDSAILFAGFNGTETISSISDAGCGGTWVHGPTVSNGSLVTIDSYTLTNATGGTCNLTVNRSAGTTKMIWLVQAYSGVGSIGNTCTRAPSASANQSISCSIQTANNWMVAGFTDATVNTWTANTGNLRGQASTTTTNQVSVALNDNTSGSVGSVTNTVTYGGSASYAAGAIELIASGGASAGRNFANADYNAIILLLGSSNATYTLPAAGGSSSVLSFWCGFPLSAGANTYTIFPQPPALLNNQSSGIVLPTWQSRRVCFDATNYWMEPPLVPSSRMLLTPSATANTFDIKTTIVQKFANTVQLTSDSSSITATTAGTAVTVFTLPTLSANTNYSFHCAGTTTQQTAGAGIGIAIQATVNAPTSLSAFGQTATSPTAVAFGAQVGIGNTTAFSILAPGTGTLTTLMPWTVDGGVQVGASVPTINLQFYTANASDSVTVKKDSFCTVMP